jgi:hypothetical protein
MLAAAGWDTQPAVAPSRFPGFAWDAPWMAQVQCVLLPSEPYAFTQRESAEISALCGRPVLRIDGEMVSWYGSRAIAGMRYLANLRQAYRGIIRAGG